MNNLLFLFATLISLVQLFISYILITETSVILKILSIIPLHCICYIWYHAGKAVGRSNEIETQRKLNKLINE